MKTVQISKAGGNLELVNREIPCPKPDWVRIKVEACGVCRSDELVKEGLWPGLKYPRVPGHELAGVVDAVGENVTSWKKGQRVGVGWYGGHCGVCPACRRGDFILCRVGPVTGFTYDGGYAEYMVAPAQTLAAIPDSLAAADAAPLLCAGVTTFNALRHSGAMAGDLVAIQAIGGLGHLAVQFASKFGYRTVAIGRGTDAQELATKLGAQAYIDSSVKNAAEELQQMGGAKAIVSTAPTGKAMSSLIDGLGENGKFIALGVSTDPIEVTPVQLMSRRRSLTSLSTGTSVESEDTLRFSALTGVRPMIEKYSLSEAAKAYDRMISGKARFRVVLTMN